MPLPMFFLDGDVFSTDVSPSIDAVLCGSLDLAPPAIDLVMGESTFPTVTAAGPKALVAAVVPAARVERH